MLGINLLSVKVQIPKLYKESVNIDFIQFQKPKSPYHLTLKYTIMEINNRLITLIPRVIICIFL